MRRAAIVLGSILAACEPGSASNLSQLSNPVLIPSGGSNLFNGELVLTTQLDNGGCAPFTGALTASEDGVALSMTTVGETPQYPNGGELCVPAELDAAVSPDAGTGVTVFDLTDGQSTIHAEYPALHASRELEFDPNEPVAVGSQIKMTWIPASDTLMPLGTAQLPQAQAWFTLSNGTLVGTELQSGDGILIVTVPQIPAGTATMNLMMATTVSATTCTGPATCGTYGDTYSFQVPLQVTAH